MSDERDLSFISDVNFEWIQSYSHITVTFFCSDLKKEDINLKYGDGSYLQLEFLSKNQKVLLRLFDFVVPEASTFRICKSTIEVKLRKQTEYYWPRLIKEGNKISPTELRKIVSSKDENSSKNSEALKKKKDWNKIDWEIKKAEEESKEEGEGALEKLFKKIYANADDDTRRAMNKSFSESRGTVLSTNWAEVGSKKVNVELPGGLEENHH
ncbi:protein SGT1 homolog [Zophobas morio]|uniref:protein SGT1 homolog n=1 Tax=Zophobas morio TaxID=2755281 RepID=UPI0030830045